MRAIWSGGISFGLVYIPVKLYSTAQPGEELHFHMLKKGDLCPIKYLRVCQSTGKQVPWKDIVKGYEYQKGDYIVLDDSDFDKAYPKKSKTLDIVDFVDRDEIEMKYFEKPYFIEPEKGAAKTYALLRDALKKSNKVGITKYVLRSKEHIGILSADDNIIYLEQMRFDEELRPAADVNVPKETVTKKELDLALNLIDQMSGKFEAAKYKDTTRSELMKIIKAKAKGVKPTKKATKPTKATPTNDLMKMLQASLGKPAKRAHA